MVYYLKPSSPASVMPGQALSEAKDLLRVSQIRFLAMPGMTKRATTARAVYTIL
jgi:hypothetical protein